LLREYVKFFNTALQRSPTPENPFDRIYIDAFAGTGECDIKLDAEHRISIAGSARIAADAVPSFHKIHLVDLNPKHVQALKGIKVDGGAELTVHQNDANAALNEILRTVPWRRTRGVLFLDPYGMAVDWSTLERIAETRALDVWYLFPLSGVYRQAANDFDKVDEPKAAKLDSVLGTTAWRTAFYRPDPQASLLGHQAGVTRTAGPNEIATFVHMRLQSIFRGWVSPPIFLPETGAPMFALFFAVANPAEKAVQLSKKAAEHLFGMLRTKRIGNVEKSPSAEHGNGDLFDFSD
jgi:three-Cys-motif partner protein